MSDRVEILLATHDSERYVGELLSSLLSQTYKDIAVTVRDDGSRDATADIVAGCGDGRVALLGDRAASGSAKSNFFRLLLQSTGDYIMFADADDVWLPDKVETTLGRMKETERRFGKDTPVLVHGDLIVADENLGVRAPSLFKYERLSPERKTLKNLLCQNNVTGCTVMINRALADLVECEPEHAVMHDWWLALIAAAFGRIEVIYRPLMYYRQHADNAVGAYDASDPAAALKRLADSERVKRIYREMFLQAGCFAKTFGDRLGEDERRVCLEYGSLINKSKAGRVASVIKNGFYKNTLVRNIGQLLKI